MPHDIAFLHTSPVHMATFDQLMRELAPDLRVAHVVREDLLADAQTEGADSPPLVARIRQAMGDAGASGASVVVCTCSTIGGLAERTPTDGRFRAARIDRAMADRAAVLGPRVLVVAALESTVGPTTELIRESARSLAATLEIRTLVVEDAWPHLQRGDRPAYLQAVVQAVVQAVSSAAGSTDVVVLAQASMAPAAARLGGLGVDVLSSPALGVQAIAAFFAD